MNRRIAVRKCAARHAVWLCNAVGVNRRGVLLVVILACVVSIRTAEEPLPSAPYMVTFSPSTTTRMRCASPYRAKSSRWV